MANLVKVLDERSALAESRQAEIVALKTSLGPLDDQLRSTKEETALQATALQNAERALSEKTLEVTKLAGALNERSGIAQSQKAEIAALKTKLGTLSDQLRASEKEVAIKAADLQKAERALSDKTSELIQVAGVLSKRSEFAKLQADEVVTLKTRLSALGDQLRIAEGETANRTMALRNTERSLSDKTSEIARLAHVLEERSGLAKSQQAEIAALKMQVQTQGKRLVQAGEEVTAAKSLRDAEHVKLEGLTRKLSEQRAKFEKFYGRVAELVPQLAAEISDTQAVHRRAQELENRLVQQSRISNATEIELEQLRAENEMAHKTEADLRIAIVDTENRAKAAAQSLVAERAQLQAALDRTKARLRAAHDQANGEPTGLGRGNATPRERVNGAVPQPVRRVASG